MVVIVAYFHFVSKDWYPLWSTITLVHFILQTLLLIFAPTSPKWLIAKGRNDEAIQALNYIAKVNGSKNRIPENALLTETEEENISLDNISQSLL